MDPEEVAKKLKGAKIIDIDVQYGYFCETWRIKTTKGTLELIPDFDTEGSIPSNVEEKIYCFIRAEIE